jgi:isoquinoline 1-oxidoreductase beta subunit
MVAPKINRRSFLASVAAAGGGLALGFEIPFAAAETGAADHAEITAWIVIQPDDTVIIRVARSEMGQGSSTALPMLLAEELECDWSKVRHEFVAPHENLRRRRAWGDMSTGGSRSVRNSQDLLRRAGATAREMLIGAAAAQWNVPTSECQAANSVITHASSGRSLRYGEIAEAAAKIKPPPKVQLKEPKDWKLIGTPQKRLDISDKIQGKTIYGIDVRVPDMLHAAIAHCPVFGGKLISVDEQTIVGRKGVRKIVKLEDAVAVVADSWWQAKSALDQLAITWDEGANGNVSSSAISNFLRDGLASNDGGLGREEGDIAAGFARATNRVEADYSVPFLAHATLEPQNCTARVTADKVEVWAPSQNGEAALAAAAAAAEVHPSKVVVHKMMLGGGFGRRGVVQDFVRTAVLIAKQVPRPVKVIWSREEDTRHDFYRPAAMARMSAGLDASGTPAAVRVRLTGNSILGTLFPERVVEGVDKHFQEGFLADMPYAFDNYHVDYAMRNTHVPVGFWRSVNHSQNAFFRECFLDEMAHAAGRDPYMFRRKLLDEKPKHLAVLDAVAKQAGWDAAAPAGRHRGIALQEANNSYMAAVIEVSVDNGKVKPHRVVCAIDPGYAVNPLTIDMQVESSVVFGLTAALYGEITIKDGRVEQSNFDDYEMLRMAEMPKVETIIMPSGGFWGGVGEPVVALVAPALCNAIFAATGKRIRWLPLKNHDLRKA